MTDRISGMGSAVASSMMQMWQDYLFKKVDANSDGSLDKSEVEAVSQTGQDVESIFSSLDTNQDSLISMQEAEGDLSKMGQDMKKEGLPMNMGMMKGRGGQNGSDSGENIFDSLDANSDGYVSQDELTATFGNEAGKIMGLVDTDGDGQISRAESDAHEAKKAQQGNMTNPGMSASQGQMFTDFFNSIDTNQDGQISGDELKTAMGDNADNVSSVLGQMDTNEDGSIDSSEFETAMQASMPPPPPPPPGGMAGTDDSSSSSASASGQTEETVFSAIDTNGDGYISPEELAAYLEQRDGGSNGSSSLFSVLLGSKIDTTG